ncbi:hypothetical protein DL96DRAFT_1598355 [Flagelloscypha sp. PMI_526]|nr:hypothetical protein DL96DRAFT_1598355 [Flagelloscypha sp. PMI_526]
MYAQNYQQHQGYRPPSAAPSHYSSHTPAPGGPHHSNSMSRPHRNSSQRAHYPPSAGYGARFSAVDSDGSGSISVGELKQALVNEFDLDTVKMLMGIFDTDRSGTIGFHEFAGLWKYISDWQNVFKHFDHDRSGSIEGRELSEALKSFGYHLSPTLLRLVEQKYASEPTTGYGPPPGITFDRFVRACVVVKTLTEAFQRVDTDPRRMGPNFVSAVYGKSSFVSPSDGLT